MELQTWIYCTKLRNVEVRYSKMSSKDKSLFKFGKLEMPSLVQLCIYLRKPLKARLSFLCILYAIPKCWAFHEIWSACTAPSPSDLLKNPGVLLPAGSCLIWSPYRPFRNFLMKKSNNYRGTPHSQWSTSVVTSCRCISFSCALKSARTGPCQYKFSIDYIQPVCYLHSLMVQFRERLSIWCNVFSVGNLKGFGAWEQ